MDYVDGTGISADYEVAADRNEVTLHPGSPEAGVIYTCAVPDAETPVLTDKHGEDPVLKRNAG